MATMTIALGALRDIVAEALAPVEDTDPAVFADIVEAVVPPALLVEWDDPWLEAGVGLTTLGPCLYTARLRIVMVAGRLEPGPGYDTLDQLAAYVLGRMRADTYPWALESISAPLQRDLAGMSHLVANAVYTTPTSL